MTVNIGAIGLSALEGAGLLAIQQSGPPRIFFWKAANGKDQALLPHVVVEERHLDEMVITDHPVELGAAISDHAYKRPAEVAIRAGWSEGSQGKTTAIGVSGITPQSTSPIFPSSEDPNYLKRLYFALLDLQADRTLVKLITGKRAYENMLLRALQVTTDEKTEHALMVGAVFREVIIAKTQTVTLADAALHKNPQSTAATTNRGTLQPQPAVAAAGARS